MSGALYCSSGTNIAVDAGQFCYGVHFHVRLDQLAGLLLKNTKGVPKRQNISTIVHFTYSSLVQGFVLNQETFLYIESKELIIFRTVFLPKVPIQSRSASTRAA